MSTAAETIAAHQAKDPPPPPRTFEYGGQTFQMQFNMASLIELERELDLGLHEIGEKLMKSPRIDTIRAVFWASLLQHHGKLVSYDDAVNLMVEIGFEKAGELTGAALADAMTYLFAPSPQRLEREAQEARQAERKAERKAGSAKGAG